jgi:hypothetical protein
MTEFLLAHWGDIILGFNITLLVGVGIGIRRTRRAQREIERDLAGIQQQQEEIAKMAGSSPIGGELVGLASWRDIPPELLPHLRAKLVEVLAEIDGASATRH